LIESYQSLQEDYTKTSAALLRHISQQLANGSAPAFVDPLVAFEANSSDVQVNIVWFTSLVLSLVFLKQWIRTHLKWTDVTPERKALALRQYRYINLEAWKLDSILTALPVMMQVAVILFLCGLVIFLWNIDRSVAEVTTAFAVLCLVLVATVTLLPVVIPACPYKSPLSELLVCLEIYIAYYVHIWYHQVTDALIQVVTILFPCYSKSASGDPEASLLKQRTTFGEDSYLSSLQHGISSSWREIDQNLMEKQNKNNTPLDINALLHTSSTTQSEDLLIMVLTCLSAEASSKSNSISYSIWLSTLRNILNPANALGNGFANSRSIRHRVGLLSERVQKVLFNFCRICFLPQEQLMTTGYDYSPHSPPESVQTIISVLAGMDQVPECSLEGLVEMMVCVMEHSSEIRYSEHQLQAIIGDFLAIVHFSSTAFIADSQPSSDSHPVITRALEGYCDALTRRAGVPREAELQLLNILLQLAIYEQPEAMRLSMLFNRIRMLDRRGLPNASIVIRPSAQALIALARQHLDNFPPRLAHGICQLIGQPVRFDAPIPADDWKQIIDTFESLVDDQDWWLPEMTLERINDSINLQNASIV
jgi:hypothetical protein